MTSLGGFWSYVQKDDRADQGRICQLARDVVEQFEMQTGESIELFLDRDELVWGDNWKDKIDASLASVAFFIPVLTPRYFMSVECRRELQFFARRAESLGVKDLVLPLHYVDVPALGTAEATEEDDLISLVKTFQWEDWRDLRFADLSSEAYRRGVSRLATRLVAANKRAEQVDVAEATRRLEQMPNQEDDEEPGLIDRLARAEEALPDWNVTLTGIGREIEAIGKIMQEATAEIKRGDNTARGLSHRLVIARRLAHRLSDPTDKISSFGHDFASQLHDVDHGFRAMIARASSQLAESPESKDEICEFFRMLRTLSTTAHESLSTVQQMIDSISPIEKMSRDLRPVLRKLRQGLTVMVEAREVTDAWVTLIEESGVNCDQRQD